MWHFTERHSCAREILRPHRKSNVLVYVYFETPNNWNLGRCCCSSAQSSSEKFFDTERAISRSRKVPEEEGATGQRNLSSYHSSNVSAVRMGCTGYARQWYLASCETARVEALQGCYPASSLLRKSRAYPHLAWGCRGQHALICQCAQSSLGSKYPSCTAVCS